MSTHWEWSDLAFGSKKPLRELKATFIAAPRELSAERFTELVKTYLPQGNIVLGLAKEPYVLGFEDQPQFRMLQAKTVQGIMDKISASKSPYKVYTLGYFQRELPFVLEKITWKQVLLINGSWKQTFHTTSSYYALVNSKTPYALLSPFVDEAEARAYETSVMREIKQTHPFKPGEYSEVDMLAQAAEVARYSFDYSFQTGVALGKRTGNTYDLLARAYNQVVPYQTYAMHHGAARETNFSPPHDLNHYDTNHAEVAFLINAQKDKLDLKGTTLFINLMPCPSCSRMFTQTDIAEFVYSHDHSDGYAIKMLEAAGKKVRRLI